MKTLIPLILIIACNPQNPKPNDASSKGPWEKYQKSGQDIHVGRYQYVPQSGGYINRGKLIDTATGRIWQDTCYVKGKGESCESSAWTEETVIGVTLTSEEHFDFLKAAYPERHKR